MRVALLRREVLHLNRKKRKRYKRPFWRRLPARLQGKIQQVHSPNARKRRNRQRITFTLLPLRSMRFLSVVRAALFLISILCVLQIVRITLRRFQTKQQNDVLAQQYLAQQSEKVSSEPTLLPPTEPPVYSPTPAPTLVPTPVSTPFQAVSAEKSSPIVQSTKFHQYGGTPLPEMEALYQKNHHLIAWIDIPDVLSLPVVYNDNVYYLSRDFYRKKNESGTIFLDENHPFRESTQNLLLHGHNMKDGTMFGHLVQYVTDKSYIKNHPFIHLSTLWDEEQYVIFSVLDVSLDIKSNAFIDYFSHATFSSDLEFETYVRSLQIKSMYVLSVDVVPSDALLMLSTCLGENRLVIAARKIREGEDRDRLRRIIGMAVRR